MPGAGDNGSAEPAPKQVKATSPGGINIGALDAQHIPVKVIDDYRNAIAAMAQSEKPGAFHDMLLECGKMSDSQLATLVPSAFFGLQMISNVTYGLNNYVQVNLGTGVQSTNTIEDMAPGVSTTFPVPISALSTIAINAEAIANFLAPLCGASVTAKNLKVLAAHCSLRVSAGEGNIVTQKRGGYVYACTEGHFKLLRQGNVGMAYLPKGMGGETRASLRTNLQTTILQQDIPAAGGVPGFTVFNTVAVVEISGANVPGEAIRSARLCYRALNTARAQAAHPRMVRFIAGLLHYLFTPLFKPVHDACGDNVFDLIAADVPTNVQQIGAVVPAGLIGAGTDLKRPRGL